MNRLAIVLLAGALLLPLSACDKGRGDDQLAGRVKAAADNSADALKNQADLLKNEAKLLDNRADVIRATGENRAAAIDAANLNANAMTPEERDAIVNDQAPAVR